MISGNNISRIFSIASGKTVTISGMTLRDGKALAVPGLSTNARPGGGVYNAGALTLRDCEIRNNVAGEPGVASAQGGGIHNASGASLTMRNCAVAFNTALAGQAQGGGIYNRGQTNLMSCTIASNQLSVVGGTKSGEGAGIANAYGAVATVTNCTISHNVFGARGGSYGGSPLTQHIGLGEATQVKSVVVTWPRSGRTQRFVDVVIDRRCRLVEARGNVETK